MAEQIPPPDKFPKKPIAEAVSAAYANEAEEQSDIDERIEALHTMKTKRESLSPEMLKLLEDTEKTDPEQMANIGTETPIIVKPEDVPEYIKEDMGKSEVDSERTKLRGLIDKLVGSTKEKLENVAEGVSEGFTRSKNYLDNRAKEIDKSAEVSGLEKFTRKIGEKYNKLSIIHKLGIGVGLGTATAIGATFSLPVALVGLTGLVAQRAMGAAGMFVSLEKKLQEKKVGESFQFMGIKERAALDAMLYTAVMGVAINQGLELAREYNVVERTREWLGGMFGHHVPTHPDATLSGQRIHSASPAHQAEIPKPAAVSNVGEATPVPHGLATEPPGTMPDVSVDAVKGKGYEYMMKRMWEDLQTKDLNPGDYPEESDIHKLLEIKPGDEAGINKLVHDIASNPDHGFYNPDGTNVRIDMGSHMSINTEGQIELNNVVQAPEGAPTTPEVSVAPPAEVPVAPQVEVPAPIEPPPAPPLNNVDMDNVPRPIQPLETPEYQNTTTEIIPDAAPSTPASVESTPVPRPPEASALHDSQGDVVHTAEGEPVHVGTPEQIPGTNVFGIEVSPTVPHIYADPGAEHLLVYGGSPTERAKSILGYLTQNPNKVVFAADDSGKYRIPWHLVEGKITPGAPMRTSGIFGFFSSFMEAPKPDEFEKIIK